MKQAITTVKPVRRLKRVCEGLEHRIESAAERAGYFYLSGKSKTEILYILGIAPKQHLEQILACAEAMYSGK